MLSGAETNKTTVKGIEQSQQFCKPQTRPMVQASLKMIKVRSLGRQLNLMKSGCLEGTKPKGKNSSKSMKKSMSKSKSHSKKKELNRPISRNKIQPSIYCRK